MRSRAFSTAFTISLGLSGSTAIACAPPEYPTDWVDTWIEVGSDGSFDHANDSAWVIFKGDAPTDLGKGRIGQKLVVGDAYCGANERLLFVDCRGGTAVIVDGLPIDTADMPAGFGGTAIDLIQAPIGPLDWRTVDTVNDVIDVSTTHGLTFQVDVGAEVAAMKWRNRYDPYVGCKIHYPNSAGASL